MIEVGWARPEGRFRRVFTDMLMPGAAPEQMTWVDELMRRSTTTENAVAFRRPGWTSTSRDLLPLSRRTDPGAARPGRPDEPASTSGRRLAAEIPGARLVALETRQPRAAGGRAGRPVFFAEIAAFLEPDAAASAATRRGRPPPRPHRRPHAGR